MLYVVGWIFPPKKMISLLLCKLSRYQSGNFTSLTNSKSPPSLTAPTLFLRFASTAKQIATRSTNLNKYFISLILLIQKGSSKKSEWKIDFFPVEF